MDVANFEASEEAKPRVADLIEREKTAGLSQDQAAELNHFLEMEHLMRLLKVRARQRLDNG